MSKKTGILTLIALLIIAAGAATYWFFVINTSTTDSQANLTTESEASKPASDKTVSGLIGSIGYLSSLKESLELASITGTIDGVGPFTILAPNNNAFNTLPSGTLTRLQKPENLQQLTSILNYHIIPGSLETAQLTSGQKVKTVNGQEVVVSIEGKNVYFIDAKGNKALVVKSDIKAKNGVIHVLDAVLLPQ